MNKFANNGLQEQENVNTYFRIVSEHWRNIYASDSLDGGIYRARQATVLDWIDELALEPGSRILEVGCGAGFLSIVLAQLGFRVNAIDTTEAMVQMASQHTVDAGVANLLSVDLGNVYSLDFEDGSFDVVVALGVIPWLEKPELAMQEIARVTKLGGYVSLTATNWAGLIDFLDPSNNPILRPLKPGLKKVLKSVGFHFGIYSETPRLTSHTCHYIDKTLANIKLDKIRGRTLGFGPFSLFNRPVFPRVIGQWLQVRLQLLADRNLPVFRSTGKHYIVLARKSGSQLSNHSTSAGETLPG